MAAAKTIVFAWDELPLMLSPQIILEALPPKTLGRDHVYGLWNEEGFPGHRIGKKLIVGRDAFRKWLGE